VNRTLRFEGQVGEVKSIGAGVYKDEGNRLHICLPEFLAAHGFADTPENRDTAISAFRRALSVPVIVTSDEQRN
jgi:hypothetical protein